jgi:hypothetical protein
MRLRRVHATLFTLCATIIQVFDCTFRRGLLLVAEPSLDLPFETRVMPHRRRLSCLVDDVFHVAPRGGKVSLAPGNLAMTQAAAHLSQVLYDLLIRLRRLVLGVRGSSPPSA